MSKLDAEDLLAAWQVLWGHLNPDWHPLFISDPLVEQIIWYDSEFIYPSLKKFRKLSDVLQNIKESTRIEYAPGNIEIKRDFLDYLSEKAEKEANREIRERPKQVKPNPSEMPPLKFDGNVPWGDWWRES